MTRARFAFQPLEALLRAQLRPELNGAGQPASLTRRMAAVLGCDPAQIARWRRYGLLQEQAEKGAVKAGVTPWTLWPDEWFEAVTKPCEARGCEARFVPVRRTHRFCSTACGHRERQRDWYRHRYQSDPEFAAAEVARRQAHYAACLAYELAYHKRLYRAKKAA